MEINYEISYKVIQAFIENKYRQYMANCDKYYDQAKLMTREESFERKFMRIMQPKSDLRAFF